MKRFGLLLCTLALWPQLGKAQSILPANTPVVVTTDGLWVPDSQSSIPLLQVHTGWFPGSGGALVRPSVEWDRATDTFLVSSGAQLFRVTITSLAPQTFSVDEITPASSAPLDLWDLDIHPGTGELFLLDQTDNVVLRFAPPFALGMTPDLAIDVPGTSRALAVDSRNFPPSILVGETAAVTRVRYDGTQVLVTELNGGRGLDADPQTLGNGATFVVAPNANQVLRSASNPNLVVSMNQFGFCVPLAIKPEDVEWNPLKHRAFVLASDGVNPSAGCQSQVPAIGPNHVLSFPIAQAPPVVVPKLLTFGGGSGITGTQGDLTLVLDDFAFVAPYGESCSLGAPSTLELFAPYVPDLDYSSLEFALSDASPNAAVYALAGFAPAQLPFGLGCSVLVQPDFVKFVGMTDSQGDFLIEVPMPPGVFAGFEAFVQLVVADGGALTLSQALRVHYGD